MLKTILLSVTFGLALACAGPSGHLQGSATQPVAVYPCGPELQAVLDEHGLPLHGSAAPADARTSRIIVPLTEGHFRLEGLAPGRYYVESPPLSYPGDDAFIDQIFAGGGCVYFSHRQSQLIEVVAGETAEVHLK